MRGSRVKKGDHPLEFQKNDELAVGILRDISKELSLPYSHVRGLFTKEQNVEVTSMFWKMIDEKSPDHSFTNVSRCPCCNKLWLE